MTVATNEVYFPLFIDFEACRSSPPPAHGGEVTVFVAKMMRLITRVGGKR